MRFASVKIRIIVRLPAFSRSKIAIFDLCLRDWRYSRTGLSRKCSQVPAKFHRERQVLQCPCFPFGTKKTLALAQIYECPSLSCDTFHGRKDVLEQMDCYFDRDLDEGSGQRSFALCGFGRYLFAPIYSLCY